MLLSASALFFSANKANKLRIGINPWPGYMLIVVAEELGFYEEQGIDIELVDIGALSDVRQAFENKQINAMTCTVTEVLQAKLLSGVDAKIVMVPDFSYGGDVILARKDLHSFQELKGKRVGIEMASLGEFVLHRALEINDMSLKDVQAIYVDQPYGLEFMQEGKIDAYISYPPYSQEILEKMHANEVFSSREIPGEIVDVVAISPDFIANSPQVIQKFMLAYEKAYQYMQSNPHHVHEIMAKYQGVKVEAIEKSLKEVVILDLKAQRTVLQNKKVEGSIKGISRVMKLEKELSNFILSDFIDKNLILKTQNEL